MSWYVCWQARDEALEKVVQTQAQDLQQALQRVQSADAAAAQQHTQLQQATAGWRTAADKAAHLERAVQCFRTRLHRRTRQLQEVLSQQQQPHATGTNKEVKRWHVTGTMQLDDMPHRPATAPDLVEQTG